MAGAGGTAVRRTASVRTAGSRRRTAGSKSPRDGESASHAARLPDRAAMARAVTEFLRAARIQLPAPDRGRTPARVADAWAEDLISGYRVDPVAELTSEPGEGGGFVVLRDIQFHSTCLHHLLPFHGRAHVAYLPDRRLAGLSKIARVVDILSRRLQVQERLTDGVVEVLARALQPAGAACIIEAEHMCVACRGVRKSGVRIVTSRFSGRLARGRLREEALRLLLPRARR